MESNPSEWPRKRQLAFKSGWMGAASFGRPALIQAALQPESDRSALERALAARIFERYGAPDMLSAVKAARGEIADMAELCAHLAGILLTIAREFSEDGGVREHVRAAPPKGAGRHARLWAFGED